MKSTKLLFLLSVAALTGCTQIPEEWGKGEIDHYYSQNNFEMVDKIARQNGKGYGDYDFFPAPTHVLVHRGLEARNSSYFDMALSGVSAMDKEWNDDAIIAYKEMIPYLKKNGVKIALHSKPNDQCNWDTQYLRKAHSDAVWLTTDTINLESAYWFSIYASANCPTIENRAIYVSLLAEIDFEKSEEEIHALLSSNLSNPESRNDVMNELCSLREPYTDYDGSGLYKLEAAGLFKCK